MGCAIPSRIHPHGKRQTDPAELSRPKRMKAFTFAAAGLLVLAPSLLAQDTISVASDTSYEDYREPPLSLPMGIGLRIPTYDRVNGLSLPWGPQLILADER